MTEDLGTSQKVQVGTPAELAAAREARGMSQIAVSQRIKLQVRQVAALEEGQWSALPGRAFVRGALRSYGKLLEVDVSPLLESIGGFAEPSEVSVMQPLETSSSRSPRLGFDGGGRGRPMLWVVAGMIGMIAVVLYFGSADDASRIRSWLPGVGLPAGGGTGSEPEAPTPASTSPTSSVGAGPFASAPAADGTPPGPSPTVLTGTGVGSAGPDSANPVLTGPAAGPSVAGTADAGPAVQSVRAHPNTSAPAAAAPEMSAPAASAPETAASKTSASETAASETAAPDAAAPDAAEVAGLLRLKAGRDAWVEVRNADGALLHNRLVKGGSSIELKGSPPYRLVLGNASTVELTYEGKLQDLKPHIQGNNIARLELR